MTLKQCEEAAETIKAKLVKAGYELKKTEENRIAVNLINREVSCNDYTYIHPEHSTKILVQYCKETSGSDKYELTVMAYFTGTDTRVGFRIKEKDLENGFKKGVDRYISECKRIVETKQYADQ